MQNLAKKYKQVSLVSPSQVHFQMARSVDKCFHSTILLPNTAIHTVAGILLLHMLSLG